MSNGAASAGSNTGLLVAAVVFAAGAIGAGVYFGGSLSQEPQAEAQPQTEVEAVVAAAPEPAEETEALPEPQATPTPPTIDEVRVETDGLAVVAGRAQPGSQVTIQLDGTDSTTVDVDDSGSFAAVTFLAPTPEAQVLSVIQDDGTEQIAALEDVIIAPTQAAPDPAPVETAAVEPAPTAPAQTPVAPSTPETSTPVVADVTTQPAPEVPERAIAETADVEETPAAPVETASLAPEIETPEVAQPAESDAVAEGAAPDPTEEPAAESVAVLRSTEEGVELLNAPPRVQDNVALDTISYSAEGEVQLAGRAQPDSEVVRIYLDNEPIATLEVDPEGRWRGDLPEVDTGVYNLRVDEVAETGSVTSRIETPFKREDPAVLQAATGDSDSLARRITVQAGDTLWAISRDRYGDGLLYVQVVEANKGTIRNPDLIFPGQVFDLPE